MFENIFTILTELLYENLLIAVLSAFTWGLLSILLSPCHLSSIPLIIGYLTSYDNINIKKSITLSFSFATGIIITIAMIGLITYSLGRLMGDVGVIGNYLVALVFFVVGLYLLDVIKLSFMNGINIDKSNNKGLFSALLLGLLFGIGLGPCTFAFMAPVLAIVFQLATEKPVYSFSLLLSFALGHIILIVVAGSMVNLVQKYLNWSENFKTIKIIKRICGILVILGGFYSIYISL